VNGFTAEVDVPSALIAGGPDVNEISGNRILKEVGSCQPFLFLKGDRTKWKIPHGDPVWIKRKTHRSAPTVVTSTLLWEPAGLLQSMVLDTFNAFPATCSQRSENKNGKNKEPPPFQGDSLV
jgi:hypothetical protein